MFNSKNPARTASLPDFVTTALALLHSHSMTHPLASRLAPLMQSDLETLRSIVAECVVDTACAEERAALRAFGCELGAVQRRIRNRSIPPTREEVEIALTAVLALVTKRTQTEPEVRIDPARFSPDESLDAVDSAPKSSASS
jgi:nucleoid DNA-binding protein